MLCARGRWHGELQHQRRDGTIVTVSSRLHIGPSDDGEQRVLQIDRDVTAQKRAQAELQLAHDQLELKVQQRTAELQAANRTLLMVSACDQALVQIADEGELIAVICQIIQDEGGYPLIWAGLTAGQETVHCVASAGDRDGFLASLEARGGKAALAAGPVGEAVRSGEIALVQDISALTDDEPWRTEAVTRGFCEVAALPLLRAAGDVLGVLVIFSDRRESFGQSRLSLLDDIVKDLAFGILSLRARAERDQALRALEAKAAELRVLAGDLVRTEQRERQRIARLLHDQLQQLLVAAVYGLNDLRASSPRAAREKVVSRIDGLLHECISVSRSLTSELGHPALAEPDIAAGLDWLASWMQEKHGLEVAVRCPEPLVLPAEETRTTLLQAVRELLFNVVKHAGVRTAEIRVAADQGERVAVTVSDGGVGFDITRTQPLALRMPGAAGGGIGLVSVRERLALIGGGIEVDSSPGSGSRVTVWVPASSLDRVPGQAVAAGSADGSAPPAAARRAGEDKIRLLLVDDHAVVREGLAVQLRQEKDLDVVGEAGDGAVAVELAGSLRPDIVTMDISMPGMGGVEATRRIHALYPEVLVIGLSMADDARQAAAMREAGAVLHFSKSSSLEDLVKAIRDCAGRRPRQDSSPVDGRASRNPPKSSHDSVPSAARAHPAPPAPQDGS
jgi:signal transduction histidine kinase/DNA-binding NarL/FixJ family response regulator